MVDGLLANVGIGIVLLCCSSSFVNNVPVSVACGTDPVSLLVSYSGEFLEDDVWDESKKASSSRLLGRRISCILLLALQKSRCATVGS